MKEIDDFLNMTTQTYNPAMRAWKEGGGRIVGYCCTNVPEEIIVAAGMLPYRIRAPEGKDFSESDRYMTYQNCSYCRHLVNEALLGEYDFLDGFIGTNGCDQMRRVSDIFRTVPFAQRIEQKEFFVEFIGAPRVPGDAASEGYYRVEMERMKETIEKHLGEEITEERLREAIRETNDSRRLLHEMYDLRKADQPPMSGAESLAVTVAYTCMPREKFNRDLRALLDGLEGRVAVPDYRKRLFLYGIILDDPEWVKVIEDQGGLVVADGLCFGGRMFWELVDESLDPMEGLAKRYYDRWPCPRVTDPAGRQQRIKDVVKEWRCDGLVGERLIFCQPWGTERVATNLEVKESGLPSLWLDREYLPGGMGQIKTRVQAFLESME
jgi:benzoyl-CoA reductase/2-hydroxyglutaryl-CoA dehydratase subunit BcrC/BadD/HgdB